MATSSSSSSGLDISATSSSDALRSPNTTDDIYELTMKEILARMVGRLQMRREDKKSKANLIQCIVRSATPDDVEFLREIGRQKRTGKQENGATRKRKRQVEKNSRRTVPRLEPVDLEIPSSKRPARDPTKFLTLPTPENIKDCHRQFLEATSNSSVAMMICGVCGRQVDGKEDRVRLILLSALPNSQCLVPKTSHPAHDLFDGKLLEPCGVGQMNGETAVQTCRHCLGELGDAAANKAPKYSLANNMWIGAIPWQLKSLTFSEQLLIAHLYPRVYVFKLFPLSGGTRDQATLQRAMRGNVSTYEMDMEGIASMVEGTLMPRTPAILASIISVTFIGLGELPKKWLRQMFRVRRSAVWEALQWLKANNKYYGDINLGISQQRVGALPEDDVPAEILGIVHQSTDTQIVDQESAGYVPLEDDDDRGDTELNPDNVNEGAQDVVGGGIEEDDPDVIPLQISGAVDTDLSKLTATELCAWGMANLWREGKEGAYAVRHGRQAVNDFGRPRQGAPEEPNRPNLFEKAFPCLFPYGIGGIEADRECPVGFMEHVRWCLRYHDRRFRKHDTFPFLAFGIEQRRQVLNLARIQMRRRNFEADARLMSAITVQKLEEASRQEQQNECITDPAVRLLRQHVHATGGRVWGSNQSRYQLRSKIWSTAAVLGPPTLWMTINPCDLHDPIAQIFAGEEINLDEFLATIGPDKDVRARNIAEDPYAAAKFFHFLIRTILRTLFQVEVTDFQLKSGMGVFGRVTAYFGTVESQGRATLHLHMLVWLKDSPSSDEIRTLLKDESFRQRISDFIKMNLRAYLPGLGSQGEVKSLPNEKEIAYSRPPHPDSADYDAELVSYERRVARAKQVHTCRVRRCLFPDKFGHYKCKRRAPFANAADDFITELGKWGPKRLYEFLNTWCPSILINGRCNNDIKLVTNGEDARDFAFYMIKYASKNQMKTHNLSAVMAKGYAYHESRNLYLDSLRDRQRLLLYRLIHTINREQELAAPMVMSYLMGWGDTFNSHRYVAIYWSSFVGALFKAFPELKEIKCPSDDTSEREIQGPVPVNEDNEADPEAERRRLGEPQPEIEEDDSLDSMARQEQQESEQAESQNDLITLDADSNGRLYAKSQVVDYQCRGEELEHFSMCDYFVDTYESDYDLRDFPEEDGPAEDLDDDQHRKPGRKRHTRIRYQPVHPSYRKKVRIIRRIGHTSLPNFIGRYFPRRDDPDIHSFYCASMLTLLKPWRDLRTDLKSADETWKHAFEEFVKDSPKRIQDMISDIQYYHDCESAARKAREAHFEEGLVDAERCGNDEGEWELGEDVAHAEGVASPEERLASIIAAKNILGREEIHGRLAVEYAKQARVFEDDNTVWQVREKTVATATGDDIQRLLSWKAQMEVDANAQNSGMDPPSAQSIQDRGHVSRDEGADERTDMPQVLLEQAEMSLPAVAVSELKADQFRAYDIITRHLDDTLAGSNPEPLRMIIHGEGGTGKSRVIQTVTEAFAQKGAKYLLLKGAYTGVAASLVDGKTTHSIGMISQAGKPMTNETKAKLEQSLEHYLYMLLDECSMLAKTFIANLSRHVGIGKQKPGQSSSARSFGGMNVILCGDFHQFPPVAVSPSEALYYPVNTVRDGVESQLGHSIYREFDKVVILREQVRVTDPAWHDFLTHLRYGRVQGHHIDMLRKLVLSHPDCPPTDFGSEPWNDFSLVTPRHAVRKQWNEAAVRKHCQEKGVQLFICEAEDTIKGRTLGTLEKIGVETRNKNISGKRKDKRNDLPEAIELAVGMKVMVTQNVKTDLDITNGARGEIVDIVLHPDEPDHGNEPVVKLKHLPEYILVKLKRTRASRLEGLEESVIPIEVATKTFRIQVEMPNGKSVGRTVRRRQYPMTAAYAFTDYRAQGQTLPCVIVDIALPPTGTLSLFNLYVALSRSSGQFTIRLLRGFDERIFLTSHDPELLQEDDRLEAMDRETKLWWENLRCDEPNTE